MAVDYSGLDKIHIRDLQLRCIIGINDEERREKQDVIVNITMYLDLMAAGETDRMEDAVDYKATKKRVIDIVEGSSSFLIEHLAERIAGVCLEDGRVKRVAVTVDKPAALRFARSVAVEIIRDQTSSGR